MITNDFPVVGFSPFVVMFACALGKIRVKSIIEFNKIRSNFSRIINFKNKNFVFKFPLKTYKSKKAILDSKRQHDEKNK